MSKRVVNIIFYFIIMVLCLLSVFIKREYEYILKDNIINDNKTYEKYMNYKFIKMNTSDIIESRFSIEEKDKENMNIYMIKYNKKYILVELTSSTVVGNDIKLMKMSDDSESLDLKETIKGEDNSISFNNGYYTNKNISINIRFIIIKLVLTVVFFIIGIVGFFKNLFKKENNLLF